MSLALLLVLQILEIKIQKKNIQKTKHINYI